MRINLEDDDPSAVNRMISFLCTENYDDEGSPTSFSEEADMSEEAASEHSQETASDGDLNRVCNNITVVTIADKYKLKKLESHAFSKLQPEMYKTWSIRNLTIIAQKIYSTPSPSSELQDLIIVRAADDISELINNNRWRALMREHPDIPIALLDNLIV